MGAANACTCIRRTANHANYNYNCIYNNNYKNKKKNKINYIIKKVRSAALMAAAGLAVSR